MASLRLIERTAERPTSPKVRKSTPLPAHPRPPHLPCRKLHTRTCSYTTSGGKGADRHKHVAQLRKNADAITPEDKTIKALVKAMAEAASGDHARTFSMNPSIAQDFQRYLSMALHGVSELNLEDIVAFPFEVL